MRPRWTLGAACAAVLCSTAAWAQLPEKTAEEVFRVGGIDAPAYAAFSREPRIVADEDGFIYVRQSIPPMISVFDRNGDFVQAIGGEGEGPGEFKYAIRHGVLADTLWVLDPQNLRMTKFDLGGELLGTTRLELIRRPRPFLSPEFMTTPLVGGNALQVPSSPPVDVDHPARAAVIFGDRGFAERREVATLELPTGLIIPGVGVLWPRDFPTFPPFVAVPSTGIGWLVISEDDDDSGTVVVERFGSEAELLWKKTLTFPQVEVSARARRSLVDAALDAFAPRILQLAQREAASRGMDVPRGTREELIEESLSLPDHYAVVDRVVMGRDGCVWLRRGGETSTVEWVVLNDSGMPSFTVDLPRELSIREANMHTVWATLVDEYDVPYVVRLDLY